MAMMGTDGRRPRFLDARSRTLAVGLLYSWLCGSGLMLHAVEEPLSAGTRQRDVSADKGGPGESLLVEAESFAEPGGWKLDTQFVEVMGSPYLLAHGLGTPVADATTRVTLPGSGEYRLYVRTKDWVAPWRAVGQPGRFQVLIDGEPAETVFGTEGAQWHWQDGGVVHAKSATVTVTLRDLTGFDGRVDALYFTRGATRPPDDSQVLPVWRREQLGLATEPTVHDYDLVVVGGGYAGMGTALSAARMGCRVALVQNRPVLGGNGSSEVRVWAMGNIRRGPYPRVGEIVEEFADHATKSPGRYEEFEDDKKKRIIQAEPNIDLFLNHHAYRVDTGDKKIVAVYAFDTRTSAVKRFTAQLFADCTGHGTIGYLAGADWEMTPQGRMGMSNMWAWAEAERAVAFPETPWALDLTMRDFPYPRDHHGQWFWEGGFDKDPIGEAELIRDWNLRAVFGAFNAMKNRDGAADHRTAYLTWVAYIGGPRESRRLMGDIVLTQDDIVHKKKFPDGCVPSTWSIDLHYPKKQYAQKYPDNPFISIAVHDQRIDRSYGYPVPYRCFYSRNVDNLFMAGRCISVTHEALGTTRVMKTCGMMGEVVGRAASVCVLHDCLPSDVYRDHWPEMTELLQLPGKARRATPRDDIQVPADALPLAGPRGPDTPTGVDPAQLPGLIVDDHQAEMRGTWSSGGGLKGFVGDQYLYAAAGSDAQVTFTCPAPRTGRVEVRLAYQPHENRATQLAVVVKTPADRREIMVDMTKRPTLPHGFVSLGEYVVTQGDALSVAYGAQQANGYVHADAIQVLQVD